MPHPWGALDACRDKGSLSVLLIHCPLSKGAATPGNIPKGRILQAPALTQLRTRCRAGAHPCSGFFPVTWSPQLRTRCRPSLELPPQGFPWEKRPPFPG